MRSPPLWPDPLYGRCRCGATLTVNHLKYHCPLRPLSMPESRMHLRELVDAAYANRFDTTHVAELGYN